MRHIILKQAENSENRDIVCKHDGYISIQKLYKLITPTPLRTLEKYYIILLSEIGKVDMIYEDRNAYQWWRLSES